jgi:hypothetical protein
MAVSWPFDSTLTQDAQGNPVYSRAYSADLIARIMARYFRDGVFQSPATNLQVVQHEGMTVLVRGGAANIGGRHFLEETDRVLTVQGANPLLDRIDTVVLRLNLDQSVLAIDLYIVMGAAAAVPNAPELTRNGSIWELGLANLFIARGVNTVTQERITDTRLNGERCGVVASVVGDTDTSALYAQIQADLAAFRATEQAGFAQWSESHRAAFDAWFAQIQATLGTDVAGNLLALINQRAPQLFSASLPAGGWSASPPYAQTVAAAGLLATDTPLADVLLSDTAATAMLQLAAYGCVGRIDTAADALTVLCYEQKPATDLTLALKVVR